ncbi:MAG: MCE family protein [Nitrospirae bacterium]|nr:MCE family protein [Nitrospirota bacterium]
MKNYSAELKVGIFAIVVLMVLSFMTFNVGGFKWMQKEGYVIYAYFSNVVGLDKNTKVKIAGVDAGTIESITLDGGRAKVKIRIYKGINVYTNASASVKTSGLLGDKFLEIKPGTQEPALKEGDMIANAAEVTDVDDLIRNISKVAGDIGGLTSAVNDVLGSDASKNALKESILALREITSNLNNAIVYNDKKLRRVLDNIDDLTASLGEVVKNNKEPFTETLANVKDFTGTLKNDGPSLIKSLQSTTSELKSMLEENRPSLKSTVDNIDKISQKIQKGEGTIGKLVNDERLYESVNKAADGLGKTLSAVDRFRTFITFQGDYLTRHSDAKGAFSVTLQPKPEKYYVLGIVSDPIGKVTSTETITNGVSVKEEKIEKKIKFSAQFARRLKDHPPFEDTALRIGLTENTLGAGADYFMLNDKLKFSIDVWDFGHEEYRSKNAHLKAGADYFLFKNIFISAGYDNILNAKNSGGYVGGGLRFEDEDFKYLFGNMPKVPGK